MPEELTAVSGEGGRNYSRKKTRVAKLSISLILHSTLCCCSSLTSLVNQGMHCSKLGFSAKRNANSRSEGDKRHNCLQWLWPAAEQESIMLGFIPDPGALELFALKLCCINNEGTARLWICLQQTPVSSTFLYPVSHALNLSASYHCHKKRMRCSSVWRV